MSGSEWTSGDWRFSRGHLPRVHAGDKTICGVHQIGRNGVTEEVAANGSLIAAAPELYAALEQCETVMMIVQPRSHTKEYLACLDQARAALAKARGES